MLCLLPPETVGKAPQAKDASNQKHKARAKPKPRAKEQPKARSDSSSSDNSSSDESSSDDSSSSSQKDKGAAKRTAGAKRKEEPEQGQSEAKRHQPIPAAGVKRKEEPGQGQSEAKRHQPIPVGVSISKNQETKDQTNPDQLPDPPKQCPVRGIHKVSGTTIICGVKNFSPMVFSRVKQCFSCHCRSEHQHTLDYHEGCWMSTNCRQGKIRKGDTRPMAPRHQPAAGEQASQAMQGAAQTGDAGAAGAMAPRHQPAAGEQPSQAMQGDAGPKPHPRVTPRDCRINANYIERCAGDRAENMYLKKGQRDAQKTVALKDEMIEKLLSKLKEYSWDLILRNQTK